MKRFALAAAALLTGALALGPAGGSASTTCTGALGAVTITGTVLAGPGCDLSGTTVHGNVKITPGGSLFLGQAATITGNPTSRHATTAGVDAPPIGGHKPHVRPPGPTEDGPAGDRP